MMNATEKINYLIFHAKADINLVSACFQLINSAYGEERANLLENFFIAYKTMPSKGDLKLPETIREDEVRKLIHRYGPIVDAYLEELQEEDFTEGEFYERLWNYIAESPVFQDKKARIIALFNCAIDRRIPYFQINRTKILSMDDEEYYAIQEAIGNKLFAKLEYVLNANFEQKTERASLIVQMLDSCTNYKERCVLMTRIISYFEREIMTTRLYGMQRLSNLLSDE